MSSELWNSNWIFPKGYVGSLIMTFPILTWLSERWFCQNCRSWYFVVKSGLFSLGAEVGFCKRRRGSRTLHRERIPGCCEHPNGSWETQAWQCCLCGAALQTAPGPWCWTVWQTACGDGVGVGAQVMQWEMETSQITVIFCGQDTPLADSSNCCLGYPHVEGLFSGVSKIPGQQCCHALSGFLVLVWVFFFVFPRKVYFITL